MPFWEIQNAEFRMQNEERWVLGGQREEYRIFRMQNMGYGRSNISANSALVLQECPGAVLGQGGHENRLGKFRMKNAECRMGNGGCSVDRGKNIGFSECRIWVMGRRNISANSAFCILNS